MLLIIGSDSDRPHDWPKFAQVLYRNTKLQNAAYRAVLEQAQRNERLLSTILERLDIIMATNEEILAEAEDLKAAVAVISGGVDTMQTDLATARRRLAELESAGIAPATVAALRGAVDNVQLVADRFKAAADPEAQTPSDTTPPPPVADVPTDPTLPVDEQPAPEGEPAAPAADDAPVTEDAPVATDAPASDPVADTTS